MPWRTSPGRKRGAYLKEKLVGFRMSPKKYEALRQEAFKARKTMAQLINEALNLRFGWHELMWEEEKPVEKKPKGKKKI